MFSNAVERKTTIRPKKSCHDESSEEHFFYETRVGVGRNTPQIACETYNFKCKTVTKQLHSSYQTIILPGFIFLVTLYVECPRLEQA